MTAATARLAAGEPPINFAAHQFRAGNMAGARDDFEQMLAMLIAAVFPGARAIAAHPGDWGIDVLLGDLRAVDGQRLTDSLQRRAAALEAGQSRLAGLREELRAARQSAPAGRRAEVLRRVGDRYRQLLGEWRYPRPGDAFVRDDLTPCTRGEPYTSASPGGRTLIALAWQLAIFETARETRSSHPGFLLLDSPQKNLGRTEGDVVDRIYRHLERWLARRGQGAQIIVADNAPPRAAAADVVTRFSRQAGLID